MKERLESVVAALLAENRLEDDGDHLAVAASSEN